MTKKESELARDSEFLSVAFLIIIFPRYARHGYYSQASYHRDGYAHSLSGQYGFDDSRWASLLSIWEVYNKKLTVEFWKRLWLGINGVFGCIVVQQCMQQRLLRPILLICFITNCISWIMVSTKHPSFANVSS